ncbi:MAG: hypothetical protein ABL958_19610 [Bdellovibrionia bacterium]
MSTTGSAAWEKTKSRLRDIGFYLPLFFRSPVASIQRVPDWDIVNAMLLLVLITIPSGILSGVIARNMMTILWGIFLLPITAVIFTILITAGFYYLFMALFRVKVDPVKLFLTVVLSAIPFLVIRIIVPVLPPLLPFGVLLSGILLIVGFTDNFKLPRKQVLNLMGACFAVFMVFWIVQMIQSTSRRSAIHREIPADALQTLEKEFEQPDAE